MAHCAPHLDIVRYAQVWPTMVGWNRHRQVKDGTTVSLKIEPKGQVDDNVGLGGAYYLPPQVGDSPFDHGDSMEALLRQGAALYSAMGTYNQAVRRYCQRALQMFETPKVVEPLPPTAIAHHVENMATLEATLAPAQAPAKPDSVASNYSIQVDHARHIIMVHVDVSGSIKRSDGKAKGTELAKYHLSKRGKFQRTVMVPDSQLAFTLSVGFSPVVHTDAMTYEALTARMRAQSPVTPVHNVGVQREGDTFTVWASFDERSVKAETGSYGGHVYARTQAIANRRHRGLFLTDGLWFTFKLFTPA